LCIIAYLTDKKNLPNACSFLAYWDNNTLLALTVDVVMPPAATGVPFGTFVQTEEQTFSPPQN